MQIFGDGKAWIRIRIRIRIDVNCSIRVRDSFHQILTISHYFLCSKMNFMAGPPELPAAGAGVRGCQSHLLLTWQEHVDRPRQGLFPRDACTLSVLPGPATECCDLQGCGSAFIWSGSGSSILGWIPIRIQSGSRVLMTINWKNLQMGKKNFLITKYNLSIPRPP